MLKDGTFGLITSFASKGAFVFRCGFLDIVSQGSLGSWCFTVSDGQALPYFRGML